MSMWVVPPQLAQQATRVYLSSIASITSSDTAKRSTSTLFMNSCVRRRTSSPIGVTWPLMIGAACGTRNCGGYKMLMLWDE